MKKMLVLVLSISVAASLLGVEANAKKKTRKVERTIVVRYENPSPGSHQTGGLGVNPPQVPSGANESYVSIIVTDDVNPMAGVRVRWDLDGDGAADDSFFVCGSTTEPQAIPAGATLDVFPYIGGDANCPGSSAVIGSVKMTFSNIP